MLKRDENIYYMFIMLVWKRRFFVFLIPLIVSLSIGYWTKKAPKDYLANVTAFIPIESGSPASSKNSSAISLLLGNSGGKGGASSTFLIQSLLESKRMRRDIIENFKLNKVYGINNEEALLRILNRKVLIEFQEFKSIFAIFVEMPTPALAANVANFYISNLEKINKELRISIERELLQVLDAADPPLSPSGPFVKKNMTTSFIVALALALLSVLSVELIFHLKNEKKS